MSAHLPSRPLLALLLAPLFGLALGGAARAAGLDPDADKPYRLRVVLGIGEHRLLTPVFQERVKNELHDTLQAAFGDLAEVEVTREHPRLKEVERDGLQQALDAWTDVDNVKTHFVLIDYLDGQYEIQARQHDGYTGLASAVVRRVLLPDSDRELVARTAGLLVNEDFGLVGTLTAHGADDNVQVTLRGSGLGVPLDRWVKEGEVFDVVQVAGAGAAERATRVPWTVLRVQHGPDNGVCTCQAFYALRTSPIKDGPGIKGYRCLKLTTTRGPLRLRLVQAGARGVVPVPTQHIDVRRVGFTGEDRNLVQGATDPDGYFTTEKDTDHGRFDNLAFVSVLNGAAQVAKVPVPIVSDRPVTIPMNVGTEEKQSLTRRRDLWLNNVYGDVKTMVRLFQDEEQLLKEKKNDKALHEAREGLKYVQESMPIYTQERDYLLQEARGTPLSLGGGDQALGQLKTLEGKLKNLIGKLEEVVAQENDPSLVELKSKVAQAQTLEDQAEFGKALDLYADVVKSDKAGPDLKRHYEDLKARWEIKSPKHKDARAFIYESWSGLDPLKLLNSIDAARDALKTCEEVGDTLTPQKLLAVAADYAAALQATLGGLHPDTDEEDRAKAKIILDVADALNKLIKEAKDYLEKSGAVAK